MKRKQKIKYYEYMFFIGEIISELEFKFVINTKEIYAILMFDLVLIDGTKLKVKAYNEIADYCYKNYEKNNFVCINGRINNDMEIIINECWLCEKDKKVNCKIKTKKCLTTVKKYDKILFVTRRR